MGKINDAVANLLRSVDVATTADLGRLIDELEASTFGGEISEMSEEVQDVVGHFVDLLYTTLYTRSTGWRRKEILRLLHETEENLQSVSETLKGMVTDETA